MEEIRVYQCEDTIEGILSAVYDAGKSRGRHARRIHVCKAQEAGQEAWNVSLFEKYVQVTTDPKKAEKVMRCVRNRISRRAYEYMMAAAGSDQPDKGDIIYRFLVYGFSMGSQVTDALQIPCVHQIFQIYRRVQREARHYLEFLRFEEIFWKRMPVLFAVMEPQNAVMGLVAEHFADRLHPEWFIIYDKTHQEAAFHSPEKRWYRRRLTPEESVRLKALEHQDDTAYAALWQTFFESVSVEARENKSLQKNLMPLRYRKHVTEFSQNLLALDLDEC